jgi:hypothetical protein
MRIPDWSRIFKISCLCRSMSFTQIIFIFGSYKNFVSMKTFKIMVSGLFIILLFSFRSDSLPKEFSSLLARAKLIFTATEGMTATKCIENEQMNYEYALKYNDKNFEVRYAIRPMDSLLAQYDRGKKNGDLVIHPNKLGISLFEATLLNIGIGGENSGELPKYSFFDSAAVKSEFNADWGATAFVNIGKQFGGKKYKYCMVIFIHKDFVGDAYFFYVSDKKEGMSDLMEKPFHSLRFM